MKKFKKIAAILGTTLMAGFTIASAAAAAYPAPFVKDGVADVAIVYGSGAGVSAIDQASAANIQDSLGGYVTGGTTSVDGESVLLERSSDKLNLGDSASTVFVTSLDKDDLPTLLADGTYSDDANTEYDYTQKVTLGSNLVVKHFADSDYNGEEPTLGIKLSDDNHVLNYTLDFTTNPAYNASTLETTTLNFMGKEYYILDVKGVGDTSADNSTTLLDTASSTVLTQGETATIGGRTVSITFIGSAEVKLSVDGETTNSLAEGGTYKLSDGTYVGIKDILYSSKDGESSSVEFSIGSGKLELKDGNNIELNDETVQEITSHIIQDSSYKLNKIVLQWDVDDESFISSEDGLVMPGFGALKFTMGDFVFPTEEETTVDYSGSDVIELKTSLEDGAVTIPLISTNSTGEFDAIGKDSTNRLVTTTRTDLFFNETAGDKYVVASWNSSTEAQSFYLKMEMITEDNVNKVRFTNQITADSTTVTNGSEVSYGSVILTVDNVTRDGSKKWANVSINSGGSFHELYTAEGLKVFLPYFTTVNATGAEGELVYNTSTDGGAAAWVGQGVYNGSVGDLANHGHDSFMLFFDEEDKDSNLAGGTMFNVTLNDASDKVHVSTIDVSSTSGTYGYEIGETDNYEAYVPSDLATRTLYKTGGDQDSVVITYHGDQSYAELYLTSSEATVSSGDALGDVMFTDSEVSSYSGSNVVIVGGSCINSAAASVLGVSERTCGEAFTTATGVGEGQFLIKGFADAYTTGKLALVVAGYDVADTQNAATYLTNKDVDTSKAYIGTSSTEATLQVE